MTDHYIYSVLLADFPYFKKLDPGKRQLICQRSLEFIQETKFVGRQGLEVTDRMKILIAACSQQLTLSFKKHYLYAHFDRIFVYPQKYFSPFTQTHNVGEMNTAGVVVFSWEDFYRGIQVEDNRNVGLHEFAHALEFMDIAHKDLDKRFSYALDKEFMVAQHFITKGLNEDFFRSYALTNRAEFFAVATEYFFESPVRFSEVHPDIYLLFCKIYGQDLRKTTVSFQPLPAEKVELGKTLYTSSFITVENGIIGVLSVLFVLLFFNGFFAQHLPWKQFLFMGILFAAGRLLSGWFSSVDLHENGISVHQNFWHKLFRPFNTEKRNAHFPYEDVFTANFQGDEHYRRKTYVLTKQSDNIPSLTLHYYDAGNIKRSSISLGNVSDINGLLRKLYLEKQVCIRVEGKIKRFE